MERYLEMQEKIAEAVKANLQDAIALNDDLADHPEPVSYTHLDVYKRQQAIWSARWITGTTPRRRRKRTG